MSQENCIIRFVKDWSLPIVIIAGILSYLIFYWLEPPTAVRYFANNCVSIVQPLLLFVMLFLSFCKINPKEIHFCKWHFFVALAQSVLFIGFALLVRLCSSEELQIVFEAGMCCMICPTATASVVIVDKLGGNTSSLIAYMIISNCLASLLVPLIVPIVNLSSEISFFYAFWLIIQKVFPLLVVPFFCAWAVRVCTPRLHKALLYVRDLPFYLWLVALPLAMAVTTRAFVHSNISASCLVAMIFITICCCLFQFLYGKIIAGKYQDRISGGQAMGQKNTVFMIWMGATFLNPVSSVSGGLYSICHNVVNSYQLYKKRHSQLKVKK